MADIPSPPQPKKGAAALTRNFIHSLNTLSSWQFLLLQPASPEPSNISISTIRLTPPNAEIPSCPESQQIFRGNWNASSHSLWVTVRASYKSSNPLHIYACFQCHPVTPVLCITPSAAAYSLNTASDALPDRYPTLQLGLVKLTMPSHTCSIYQFFKQHTHLSSSPSPRGFALPRKFLP